MVLTSCTIFKKTNEKILRKVCYKQINGWVDPNVNDLAARQGSS